MVSGSRARQQPKLAHAHALRRGVAAPGVGAGRAGVGKGAGRYAAGRPSLVAGIGARGQRVQRMEVRSHAPHKAIQRGELLPLCDVLHHSGGMEVVSYSPFHRTPSELIGGADPAHPPPLTSPAVATGTGCSPRGPGIARRRQTPPGAPLRCHGHATATPRLPGAGRAR